MPQSSILDPIQASLSPLVWDHPEAAEPTLKPVHAHFITRHIYEVLERGGYSKPHDWLDLYLSGSLTTLQFSDDSDCDISLFIRLPAPEWSRAEMIGLMIEGLDGVQLPGTPYPLQGYVVSKKIKPHDIYRPGLRSGYDIATHHWVVPPEPHRVHDVKAQEEGFYVWAMQAADKMERLLRYEPDKAVDYWHQIHRRRMRDQVAGKGDYSESNIMYKFLAKRGLMPQIAEASGEHIARAPVAPITQAEARGNSRPVSHEEFQQLATQGQQHYNALAADTAPTAGLDTNWEHLKQHAYESVQQPWGGATIHARSGQPLASDADMYALSAKSPGMNTVSVPVGASPGAFHQAMDSAKVQYQHLLERANHYLGVFRDDAQGSIDFDPTVVVNTPQEVESLGAYTRAIGGAYHFATGDGYFPPHVPDSASLAA